MTEPTIGRKDDQGKLRYDLLQTDLALALNEVVGALTRGAVEYGPGNWQYVDDAMNRYLAASGRHEARFQLEGPIDESNYHHLAHKVCSELFRLELALREQRNAQAE